MFDILPTFGSEGAAYVARHDSEVMRRLPENSPGQNVPHPMRILNVRVKRISILLGVIVTYCPARLHVLSVDPRYDVSPSYDMARGLERTVCLRPVSDLEHVRHVVGTFIPNGWRGRRHCEVARRDCRHRRVAHVDQFHGILGLIQRIGHDHRDRISDVSDACLCKTWMSPPEHRRAVWARSFEGDSRTAQTIRCPVRGDEDADDAGSIAGIFKFDRLDRSMRMGRPQEASVSLTWKSPIRDVRAPSAQQTPVFEAAQRLANPERPHEGSFVSPSRSDSRWIRVSQLVAPVVLTRARLWIRARWTERPVSPHQELFVIRECAACAHSTADERIRYERRPCSRRRMDGLSKTSL